MIFNSASGNKILRGEQKSVSPFSLLFGLMVLSLLSTPAMTSANTLYKTGSNWYKINASVAFRNNHSFRDRVSLYPNEHTVSGQTVRGVFNAIPAHLKTALFSGQTINPFRAVFADVQAAYQRGQLNNCSFVGIELPLNGSAQSREWLISAPVQMCLTGGYQRSREPGSHVWLLQRNAQGRYQVMMESAGLIQVIDEAAAYKQLRTRLYDFHLNPGNPQSCGYASVTWSYRHGRYWPTQLFPKTNGCERIASHLNEAQRFQQVEQGVMLGLRKITGQTAKRLGNGNLVY